MFKQHHKSYYTKIFYTLQLLMIELFGLVDGFAGNVYAEFLEDLIVD